MILHICTQKEWDEAKAQGFYECESLSTESFIHCSTKEQVLEVANFMFKGKEVILLMIDEALLTAELKYEEASNGKKYPHIYGRINTDAVTKTMQLPTQEDGDFVLPDFK